MKRPGQGFGGGGGSGGDFGAPHRPKQAKIDEEYMSLMAELGEGPPPPAADKDKSGDSRPAWQQNSRAGAGMFGGGRGRGGPPRPLMGPDHGPSGNEYGGDHNDHGRGRGGGVAGTEPGLGKVAANR